MMPPGPRASRRCRAPAVDGRRGDAVLRQHPAKPSISTRAWPNPWHMTATGRAAGSAPSSSGSPASRRGPGVPPRRCLPRIHLPVPVPGPVPRGPGTGTGRPCRSGSRGGQAHWAT
jgi:hypothetical protein